MIRDLRANEAPDPIEADLCIVGAGAAGITMARALAETRLRICLVESGGLEPEPATQELYQGECVGLPNPGMETGRLRFFGGTTNHWGGRCTPLSRAAFRSRPWVAHSGWPIEPEALDPFYPGAWSLCGLPPLQSTDDCLRQLGLGAPPLDRDRLELKVWKFTTGKTAWSFGRLYRDDLKRARNVTVLLHANLTALTTNASGTRIEAITATSLSGERRRIRARAYALCCGAIENARLLLALSRSGPARAWNRRDLIGRFYMEHLRGPTGVMLAPEGSATLQRIFNFHDLGEIQHQIGLALSAEAQEAEGLLAASAVLEYRGDPQSGVAAGQSIWRALRRGEWPDDFSGKLFRVLADLDEVAANTSERLFHRRRPIYPLSAAHILVDVEQAPNPESRVTLADESDPLGMPRARLSWKVSDHERRTALAFTRNIGIELARLGLARCRIEPWLAEDDPSWGTRFDPTFHQMGTTRMSDDPATGVVDRDCRMHGVENLYIGGSSVFPTFGHENPTLTIVALALRLAQHVKTALA
jgi:choline dehydrogenase-like flavoprotein